MKPPAMRPVRGRGKKKAEPSPRISLRVLGTVKFDRTNSIGQHSLWGSTGKDLLDLVLDMNDAELKDFESVILQTIKPYSCSVEGCSRTVGYVVEEAFMCKNHMLDSLSQAGNTNISVRCSPPGEAFTLKLEDPFPQELLPHYTPEDPLELDDE